MIVFKNMNTKNTESREKFLSLYSTELGPSYISAASSYILFVFYIAAFNYSLQF